MPIKRQFAPRSVELPDIKLGRVEPQYTKVLMRLLSAHALAEKLTAEGYDRAAGLSVTDELRTVIEKNRAEERKHAGLVYHLLTELGVTEAAADRMMITARKSPSFEAPRRFAERARTELDLLMASLSLDVTGLIMIGINYKDSSYAPHCRAAEIILEEESDHESFAMEALSEAAEQFGPDSVNQALSEWLPAAVNFFGPPGSGFTYDCLRLGLKAKDNEELAELYLTVLGRKVEQLGLQMPTLTTQYPRALAQ